MMARWLIWVFCLLCFSPPVHALLPLLQAEPDIDLGEAGIVFAMVTLSDQSVVLAGDFNRIYDPATNSHHVRNNIARLMADGSLDLNFAPDIAGSVRALAVDAEDRVYLGGTFASVNGEARGNLARIAGQSGALDLDWNPYANESVLALYFDRTSSTLYAGGDFIAIGGLLRARLARLSASTWGPAIGSFQADANETVWTLAGNGTSIFAGGDFTNVGGVARNYLAKLSASGVVDGTWNPAPSHEVYALAFAVGGTALYVGGRYVQIGAQARAFAARLSVAGAGAVDLTWNPSPNSTVFSIAESPYGWTYLAGAFTQASGFNVGYGARVLSGGNVDNSWKPNLDHFALSVCYAEIDRVLVGGSFSSTNGRPASALALYSVFNTFGSVKLGAERSGAHVADLAALPDGSVMVAGTFTRVSEGGFHYWRKHVFKLGSNDRVDTTWHVPADAGVLSLAVDASSQVYAGGRFSTFGGQARSGLARFSSTAAGALDANWNPSVRGQVRTLLLDQANRLLIGGSFDQIAGTARLNLARVAATGTGALDSGFQVDTDSQVDQLRLDQASRLIVAGYFNNIGGAVRPYLARLSGSSVDLTWQQSVQFMPAAIDTAGTDTYVSATFADQSNRATLARIDGAGVLDLSWAPPLPPSEYFSAIKRASDGSVHAAGQRWVRVSGSAPGVLDSEWQINTNGVIRRVLERSNGRWLAAGDFTEVNGVAKRHLFAVTGATVFANGFE